MESAAVPIGQGHNHAPHPSHGTENLGMPAQVDTYSLELRAYPAVTHHSTLDSGRQLL